MKLGFFTALFPDLELPDVARLAAEEGFECLEIACWPRARADRRYAGITHVDLDSLTDDGAREIRQMLASLGLSISALGYYPNPLCADEAEAAAAIEHIRKMISAAPSLGAPVANTFLGRDPALPVEENWRRFDRRWPAIVEHAERCGIRIGIENCPMLFTADEWPGGKNLAVSPRIWREMFRRIPSPHLGLNYDPSHALWQQMHSPNHIRQFADRIFHVHAKDARVLPHLLDEVGILAAPLDFHQPRLPGLGQVPWGEFFAALTEIRYDGAVCIEVEDRAYEGSLDDRRRALRQSRRFLQNYCGR